MVAGEIVRLQHDLPPAPAAAQPQSHPGDSKVGQGQRHGRGLTNVRNVGSPHWRRWLGPARRCLVPLNNFAEPRTGKGAGNAWFAVADGRSAMLTGFRVGKWRSIRKLKDGETIDDLYAFLTTEPNAEVAAVHPKAMPVVLTERSAWDTWLSAPWSEAAALQRPLADGTLEIVA